MVRVTLHHQIARTLPQVRHAFHNENYHGWQGGQVLRVPQVGLFRDAIPRHRRLNGRLHLGGH
eukprot:2701752-Prymnesium_polylepis.1